MKTNELTGAALDWAVAKCEGEVLGEDLFGLRPIIAAPAFTQQFKPSTDWSQGGPIIEREKIRLNYGVGEEGFYCEAYITAGTCQHGPTPLTAAMRCYVASKLGDKVDVPEELSC